jgi:hypothetical protein
VCNAMAIVSKFCPQVLQVCTHAAAAGCHANSGSRSGCVRFSALRNGTAFSATVPCTHTGRGGSRQRPLHVHS